MNINGFKLPDALEANLRSGRYKLSAEQTARLKAALSRINNPDPFFFDCSEIPDVNRLWTSRHVKCYLGNSSQQYPPGDIDPKHALIIGEAEPDNPIALDYRTAEPRVIYLCEIDYVSYWVEFSPNYAALMKTIGVTEGS